VNQLKLLDLARRRKLRVRIQTSDGWQTEPGVVGGIDILDSVPFLRLQYELGAEHIPLREITLVHPVLDGARLVA